jgi:hypothetical protein
MKDTIFCDIDGTIFEYRKFETFKTTPAIPTPGSLARMNQWDLDGHMIILTTARPEWMRKHTIKELKMNRVPWHRLIMGIGMGDRLLINDLNPRKPGDRAYAFNVERDAGLDKVEKVDA